VRSGAWLPVTGLVIGSMVPDLPYYLPSGLIGLPIDSSFTHSPRGVVSLDVVLGLACVALWHGLLAPAAVLLAPASLRRRLAPGTPARLRELAITPGRLAGVAAALAIGALTHVGWDAFTHENRYGTAHLEWLAASHGPLAGYRWAQYASGVFGGLVVLAWLSTWWRAGGGWAGSAGGPAGAGDRLAGPELPGWVRVGVLAVIGAALIIGAAAGGLIGMHQNAGLRHSLFMVATAGGGSAAGAAVLLASILRLARGSAQNAHSDPACEARASATR
jgi:hypothetical protein